jgi:hypothetical protein
MRHWNGTDFRDTLSWGRDGSEIPSMGQERWTGRPIWRAVANANYTAS